MTEKPKKWQTFKKTCKFYQKIVKTRDVQMFKNHSINTRNYAVTYYKSLKRLSWNLGLKKLKKWHRKKNLKLLKS